MIFLDTDACISFFQGSKELQIVIEKFKEPIAITSPTIFEVKCGINYFEKKYKKNEDPILLQKFKLFKIFNFGEQAAINASEIWADLKINGRMIKIMDILIGSIILTNNSKNIISNDEHFKNIQGLNVINY